MLKKLTFLYFFVSVLPILGIAQQNFNLTGNVIDENGKPLDRATVFIDGTYKSTYATAKGDYYFNNLVPGTYQVIARSIGFISLKKDVIIKKSEIVNFKLQSNLTLLKEVNVKKKKSKPKKDLVLNLFKKEFLGITPNGMSCRIENPNIIEFKKSRDTLNATSSDFIIVINPNLGYRIKYLLREFRFIYETKITAFDGECVFEELEGTEEQKNIWLENRANVYYGSLMHYLRALYTNTTKKEGFYSFVANNNNKMIMLSPTPTDLTPYITKTDSTFINFKIPNLMYVKYQPSLFNTNTTEGEKRLLYTGGSFIRLLTDKATIDLRGNYVDIKSFLLQREWGSKRLGDKLPFEYQPPNKTPQ